MLHAVVPQTASSAEKVLMVATFGGKVVAARGTKYISSNAGRFFLDNNRQWQNKCRKVYVLKDSTLMVMIS